MYAKETARWELDFLVEENEKAEPTESDDHTAAVSAAVAATERIASWLVDQALDTNVSLRPLLALVEIIMAPWWSRCWVVQS